jgi:hypothetical protein
MITDNITPEDQGEKNEQQEGSEVAPKREQRGDP